MINVYSFQKMSSQQQLDSDKNISKSSQLVFGQNYKKIIANSKVSFDFRKFLQKNHQHRKNISHKQQAKRLPLQQVSSQHNTQSLLNNKAFKIRCYSRKIAKQNQQKLQQSYTSKLIKYRPKIYQIKLKKTESNLKKYNLEQYQTIKLHKFDNYQLLQSTSNNIKVFYNTSAAKGQEKSYDKTIIIDFEYLLSIFKSSLIKSNDKQKEFYRKRLINFLKKIIDQKNISFSLQRQRTQQTTQIIFKVKNQFQIQQLLKEFQNYQFYSYYCIFCIQTKFIEHVSTYNLMKIENLSQNLIILQNYETLIKNIPLINSGHFIGYSSLNQKSNNFLQILEKFFISIQNFQIRYSAEQHENDQKNEGHILELPIKQLIQRAKQKMNQKSYKKISRQKRERCLSSHQSLHNNLAQNKRQDKNLQVFKQKMLKYLKILGNQNQFQMKKSKQYQGSLKQEFDCCTGRQNCSKTNYQILSELIRLNSNINKQIKNYLMKNQEVTLQTHQSSLQDNEFVKTQKIFINIFS